MSGLIHFCLGWQNIVVFFLIRGIGIIASRKRSHIRLFFEPSLISVFVRSAPGLSIRPERSRGNKMKRIYWTWYMTNPL
jgi:hypothetical protein